MTSVDEDLEQALRENIRLRRELGARGQGSNLARNKAVASPIAWDEFWSSMAWVAAFACFLRSKALDETPSELSRALKNSMKVPQATPSIRALAAPLRLGLGLLCRPGLLFALVALEAHFLVP